MDWDRGEQGSAQLIGPEHFGSISCKDQQLLQRSHLFSPLYHNQEVVIRIKMAELIVAFQRQPEVGSEVQFPILFQVHGQRHLYVDSIIKLPKIKLQSQTSASYTV